MDITVTKSSSLSKKRRAGNVPNSEISSTLKKIKESKTNNFLKIYRVPKFRLKNSGECASLITPHTERVPILLTDIQHLLLHSLLGDVNLSKQQHWYVLDKCGQLSQTTCLILEGVSIQHWEKNQHKLGFTSKTFSIFLEILTPSVYNGSLVQELALVPLSQAAKEDIIAKYGTINLALEARKDLMIMMKAVFPIDEGIRESSNFQCDDKFPRTQLLLSASQLIEENYPVPLKGKLKNAYSDYVMTKDSYKPVTSNSPMFGLDCEMCMTSAGLELTRVSIVNEKHETIYESYVKPYNDITDYLTRYSGITKSLLDDVTKRLEDVQCDLRNLLPPDSILVGQSLNADFHALKMMHPYVIDTSLIYNFTGQRTLKPKLKTLAKEFLNEDIQMGKKGHCSVEDSITSVKLVQLKLSKSIEYGDAVYKNSQKHNENVKLIKTPEIAVSIFNHMIEQKKSSLIIGCDDITGDYHNYLTAARESVCSQLKKVKPKKVKLDTVDGVEQVISNLCEAVHNYNFVMAHLKLEIKEENEMEQMERIDKWIETMVKSLEQSALCVVVFGGTCDHNGLAMIKIKSM